MFAGACAAPARAVAELNPRRERAVGRHWALTGRCAPGAGAAAIGTGPSHGPARARCVPALHAQLRFTLSCQTAWAKPPPSPRRGAEVHQCLKRGSGSEDPVLLLAGARLPRPGTARAALVRGLSAQAAIARACASGASPDARRRPGQQARTRAPGAAQCRTRAMTTSQGSFRRPPSARR